MRNSMRLDNRSSKNVIFQEDEEYVVYARASGELAMIRVPGTVLYRIETCGSSSIVLQ